MRIGLLDPLYYPDFIEERKKNNLKISMVLGNGFPIRFHSLLPTYVLGPESNDDESIFVFDFVFVNLNSIDLERKRQDNLASEALAHQSEVLCWGVAGSSPCANKFRFLNTLLAGSELALAHSKVCNDDSLASTCPPHYKYDKKIDVQTTIHCNQIIS